MDRVAGVVLFLRGHEQVGLPSDPVGGNMDLSNDGRLFVAPKRSNTLYAIDPTNGATLGSVSITGDGNDHISGVAVANNAT